MKALMIFQYINNNCNRSCDHCYWNSEKSSTTPKIVEDTVVWIKNICKEENVQNLKIVFLGGEPLIEVDKLYYYMDLIKQYLPQYKLSDHSMVAGCSGFTVNTNGDFLTDSILEEFKKRNASINLNPTDLSLYELESRILKIKGELKHVDLTVALNELNLKRLPDIIKLAVKHYCHVRTSRLYDGGNIPGYVEEYKKQLLLACDILLEADKPMFPGWFIEDVYPLTNSRRNFSCGKWLAVLDSDGAIRSCNVDSNSEIGSIYTHKHWSDLKFLQCRSANLVECQGCKWALLCQGGCPHTRKLTYGTYDRKSPFCEAFKELFPKLMQLTEKWRKYYVSNN
jgi:radical SAM protein with 4Fe4S-binding SPASM domain